MKKFRFTGIIIKESDLAEYFREWEFSDLLKLEVGDSVALVRHCKAYQAVRIK